MDPGADTGSDSMVVLTATDAEGAHTPEGPGAAGEAELTISKNTEAGTYEATLAGQTVAGVLYQESGDRVTLLATSVFPSSAAGEWPAHY